jgi:hypothetical protein
VITQDHQAGIASERTATDVVVNVHCAVRDVEVLDVSV